MCPVENRVDVGSTPIDVDFLTPNEVCELVPGMTPAALAQRRYKGLPPRFYKPAARLVIYDRADVLAWLRGSVQHITGGVER